MTLCLMDRRTVDRSAVASRATAAVSRFRLRLATRWTFLRFAFGGSLAAATEPPAAFVQPPATEGPAFLVQTRDAHQLSK